MAKKYTQEMNMSSSALVAVCDDSFGGQKQNKKKEGLLKCQ